MGPVLAPALSGKEKDAIDQQDHAPEDKEPGLVAEVLQELKTTEIGNEQKTDIGNDHPDVQADPGPESFGRTGLQQYKKDRPYHKAQQEPQGDGRLYILNHCIIPRVLFYLRRGYFHPFLRGFRTL